MKACEELREARAEILHIRYHSLFEQWDFDLSPYFAIVKPHLEGGFDHRGLTWASMPEAEVEGQKDCNEPG